MRKRFVSLARDIVERENRNGEFEEVEEGGREEGEDTWFIKSYTVVCLVCTRVSGNARRATRLNIYQLIPRVTQFELQ